VRGVSRPVLGSLLTTWPTWLRCPFWSLQSLAQLRDHYGIEAAEAIWSATRCKIVFGGLSDQQSLDRLSGLIPEERVQAPAESETEKGNQASHHTVWRPLLSAAQLREIPDGWSLLLYLNLPPRMLRQPLAVKRYQLRRHMEAWSPANAEAPLAQPVAERQPVEV
jgi:type IV secretory pathway TraG/TraD family ATPase VirD4